jgi:DNA replication initiation complex subunit (GINS family)
MSKLIASLIAGAFAFTLGTTAFAADAAKPVEPAKTEAAAPAPAADSATPTKVVKKHHHKHAKKTAKVAAPAAADALVGK